MAQWKRICLYCRRRRRSRFSPWVRKIPGEENGNLLQYSCLENTMDREACQATVHMVAKSWTRLSTHTVPQLSLQLFYTVFFFKLFDIVYILLCSLIFFILRCLTDLSILLHTESF